MTITRRQFSKAALAGAALCTPRIARAQDWPNRPVRFIVHLAAGGGLDFIARLVGDPHPDQGFFSRSDNIQLARMGGRADRVQFRRRRQHHVPQGHR